MALIVGDEVVFVQSCSSTTFSYSLGEIVQATSVNLAHLQTLVTGGVARAISNPYGAAGSKYYIIKISQTGTNAPTATVLANSLGGAVVWVRAGTANYTGTLANAFTVGKTIVYVTDIHSVANITTALNAITLTTEADGILSNHILVVEVKS